MKRYIVSSIVPGCTLNINFLESIKNYAKINKAQVLFIPTPKLYKKDVFDVAILRYGKVLDSNLILNKNIKISLLPINPEQADPVSGLERLNSNTTSVVYGSPKQRLKSVASPNNGTPRILLTPGACTNSYKRFSKKSLVASQDHVAGALIIEVESASIFHIRHVDADKHGNFIDLGFQYSQNGAQKPVKTEAIVLGDWHTGYTDPVVRKCSIEMFQQFKPKHLVFHDFFDGISVNHHMAHKLLTKAMLGAQSSLSAELQLNAIELKSLSQYAKKIIIVKSNHDEFLDKWLDEGKYLYDSTNHIIGLELAFAKSQGNNPLEYGINKYQKFNNVTFLKSDESYKLTSKEIECGMHGHLGPNGSRGSPVSLEKAYTRSISGHSHSPERLRGADIVGTSSYLKLSYNKGPSSWLQTHDIVYVNGSRQLITIINKKWKA